MEKEKHGYAQGACAYRAERHNHAEHRTEDHGDRSRGARSRQAVSAGQGVNADIAASEHVAKGKDIVHQQSIVARKKGMRLNAEGSESLLAAFERSQAIFEGGLELITKGRP